MIKIRFDRRGDRVRLAAAGALLAVFCAAPAIAQESQPANNIGGLKLTTPILWAAAGTPARAAAQAPAADVVSFFTGTELTGFVDFYYLYNFNTPVSQTTQLRAFDTTHSSFSLNLAELALEKKPKEDNRGGYRIDFNYGPTATLVNGAGSFENIQQAYISYLAPVGKGLQFDFGKFVTPLGAEVIETRDNWNYSRSILFFFPIPFHHTGVRASYPVSDKVSISGLLVNAVNLTTDNNTGKTVGASVTVKPTDKVTLIGNYLGGPEQPANNSNWRNTLDATLTVSLMPKVTVMGNFDYAKESFPTTPETTVTVMGFAGYLKYQVNDRLAVVPRFEYYEDQDGFTTGAVQKLKEGTITIDLKHKDGVRLLLEYRRDFSDVDAWVKDASSTPTNHQDTLTFGLVYAFGM